MISDRSASHARCGQLSPAAASLLCRCRNEHDATLHSATAQFVRCICEQHVHRTPSHALRPLLRRHPHHDLHPAPNPRSTPFSSTKMTRHVFFLFVPLAVARASQSQLDSCPLPRFCQPAACLAHPSPPQPNAPKLVSRSHRLRVICHTTHPPSLSLLSTATPRHPPILPFTSAHCQKYCKSLLINTAQTITTILNSLCMPLDPISHNTVSAAVQLSALMFLFQTFRWNNISYAKPQPAVPFRQSKILSRHHCSTLPHFERTTSAKKQLLPTKPNRKKLLKHCFLKHF